MTDLTPFHAGELEVQRLSGEHATASKLSHIIQKSIPPGALDFIRQQSIIWVGIDDGKGLPWAFPLLGKPGFIHPNQDELVEIDLNEHFPIPDHWLKSLRPGKAIGCLVIELSTRRRLRINGIIGEINNGRLRLELQQAYPNCPKYIRKREMLTKPDFCKFHPISNGNVVNEQLESIINQSDTAFVASLGPNGADISHRGGPRGFITCSASNKISMPDYQGNGMFNTLGNFKAYPYGGVTVVEFNQGHFLQLSGDVRLFFDRENLKSTAGGSNRLWELTIDRWQLFRLESNLQWENPDFSPSNSHPLQYHES